MRNPLLLLRTQTPIRAEIAVNPGLRFEDAVGDSLGCRLHAAAGGDQLGLGAGRDDRDILFQVVENQRTDGESPFFARSDRVEGQLQALVGVFLIAGLAGFVVDDGDAAVGTAVDAIDAADYRDLTHTNLKRLLGVENLRRRQGPGLAEEVAQLFDALLFVKLVLVRLLNLGCQPDRGGRGR